MGGDEKFGAKRVLRLVNQHARSIRCKLKQRATGFADIKRVEIFAIVGGGVAGALVFKDGANGLDGGLVGGAKGDVVDRARARC